MNEKTLAFYVEFRGEPAAGLHPYTDVIRVVVESGVPGGESGEFADHIRQALAEWFDGASVEPLAVAEARWACENAAEDEAHREAEELARTENLP